MEIFNEKLNLVAKTFVGLEEVLANEIREIGGTDVKIHNRAVSFRTDLEGLYKANLSLRTALHILVRLTSAEIENGKDLYDFANEVKWETVFKPTNTFSVISLVNSPLYNHTKYPALLTKDAIVDRFYDKFSVRPNVSKNFPEIVITVHIFGNKAELFLDSSGVSLHRRGYRLDKVIAPLNEVLSAGIIYLTGWDTETTFIDPMCGSGTFPIEAAMISRNIPPNLKRKKFAFINWKNFNIKLLTKVKNSIKRNIMENDVKIIGNDLSEKAIEIAKSNAERAGVLDFIEFNKTSFFDYLPPQGKKFLIFNPPYDQRIKLRNTVAFYRRIGDTLKKNYNDSTAWIFSGNKQALKKIGLSSSKKITLDNGGKMSFLRRYEIYEGSKKTKFEQKQNE